MYRRSRKRKLTDKTLPNALFQSPEFSEDSKMYRDLLDMERRLDWTISRKRVEVQDAVARIIPVRHSSPQKVGYTEWLTAPCSFLWLLATDNTDTPDIP